MTIPTIAEVMTKSPITIDAHESIVTAAKLMKEKAIRHLPVLKGGTPIAILSAQEVNSISKLYGSIGPRTNLTVGDIHHDEQLYTVAADTKITEVAQHMGETKVSAAVVVTGGKIEGIFTLVDACRYIASRGS